MEGYVIWQTRYILLWYLLLECTVLQQAVMQCCCDTILWRTAFKISTWVRRVQPECFYTLFTRDSILIFIHFHTHQRRSLEDAMVILLTQLHIRGAYSHQTYWKGVHHDISSLPELTVGIYMIFYKGARFHDPSTSRKNSETWGTSGQGWSSMWWSVILIQRNKLLFCFIFECFSEKGNLSYLACPSSLCNRGILPSLNIWGGLFVCLFNI